MVNNIATAKLHGAPANSKHRRLSSAGMMKRRMSDARDAATRPSAASIHTAAAALSSLATLSLSGSPPPQGLPQTSTSFTTASGIMRYQSADPTSELVKQEDEDAQSAQDGTGVVQAPNEISAGGITIRNGTGKKRGTIFKCESCSKVYRHPSCLIKHRWEHSPHWREASKFLLSKHQQVQLLEAAAILSHMSPSASGGRSLPDDRSLWPSFLSGGLLPPPNTSTDAATNGTKTLGGRGGGLSTLDNRPAFPVSSSVPAHSIIVPPMARSTSTGPRLHDYAISPSGGLTHVRPGVLVSRGVDSPAPSSSPALPNDMTLLGSTTTMNGSRTVPVPVPMNHTTYRDPAGYGFASNASDPWGDASPVSLGYGQSFRSSNFSGGGWSLPRSSVRSVSLSRSRSGSVSKSDEDEVQEDYADVDVDVDEVNLSEMREEFGGRGRMSATRHGHSWSLDDEGMVEDVRVKAKQDKIDEEWDGMDMEMEM